MAANGNSEVNLEMGSHPNGGEEGERVEAQDVGEKEMGDLETEVYLLMKMYADEENDSTEIKLKKRMARTALTLWQERTEMFEHRELQRKSEMRGIMNEVYQLVSLYSVFEGVVLTAVATSSRLECQHLWSPVGLSLFAYSMLVVVAFQKFWEIRELAVTKSRCEGSFRVLKTSVHELRGLGYADFDFDRACRFQTWGRMRPAPFWRYALGLLVPLTIFTAVLVFSLVHILCWS